MVTGASKGIGASLARELARRGARLGLVARDRRELDRLAAELPGDPIVHPADVSDRREIERAVAAFAEEAGGLDLLVANAGIAHYGPFAEMEIEKLYDLFPSAIREQLDKLRLATTEAAPEAGPITEEDKKRILEDIDKFFGKDQKEG